MHPIALQELRQLGDGKHWDVNQSLAELNSLEPVRGWVEATHREDDLWVCAEADTIVELTCDRCLKPFPHQLSAAVEESIALRSNSDPLDIELKSASCDGQEAMESIDPSGRFDPEHWLFEQLNLQLPLKRLCCDDCPGLIEPEEPCTEAAGAGIDPRWASLLQLRQDQQEL